MFMHRPESADPTEPRRRRTAGLSSMRFDRFGPGIVEERGGVRKATGYSHAFSLVQPTLGVHSARATAKFRVMTQGLFACVGVFPADLPLDSNVHSADGKRCSLLMMGNAPRPRGKRTLMRALLYHDVIA